MHLQLVYSRYCMLLFHQKESFRINSSPIFTTINLSLLSFKPCMAYWKIATDL